MLSVSNALKTIYKNDRLPYANTIADKQLEIYFSALSLTLTNNDINEESFSLEENLCDSSEYIKFGECLSSCVKFSIIGTYSNLKGKQFTVKQIVNGENVLLGTYIVESATSKKGSKVTDIAAYDLMKKFDVDVISWYNGLTFPTTLKAFRNSLCTHLGITYENSTLPNDSMVVEKTVSATQLMGSEVLRCCQELNGVFGHVGRNGVLKHMVLAPIYASGSTVATTDDEIPEHSMDILFEEYSVKPIDKLQIRQVEGDIGAIVGTGTNCYSITGNFLVYGKTATELTTIANNAFNNIKNRGYRPYEATSIGLPYLEVGDRFKCGDFVSYVLSRKLTGIRGLNDWLSAEGEEIISERLDTNVDIQILKGRTNVLTNTVEESVRTVTSIETKTNEITGLLCLDTLLCSDDLLCSDGIIELKTEEVRSEVRQTADSFGVQINNLSQNMNSQFLMQDASIALKVSKNNVIGELNLSAETAKINFSKIQLEGYTTINNNFKVLLDGSIEAKNGKFSGQISASSITGTEISGTNITGGTISGATIISSGTGNTTRIESGYIETTRITLNVGSSYANSLLTNASLTVNYGSSYAMYSTDISITNGTYSTNISATSGSIAGSQILTQENYGSHSHSGYAPTTHTQSSTTIIPSLTTPGNINFQGGTNAASVAWVQANYQPLSSSDLRLKRDIQSLDNIEDFYKDLKVKSYYFKGSLDDGLKHYGLLAQEVLSNGECKGLDVTGLVEEYETRGYQDEGFYTGEKAYRVNYEELHGLHIVMIQELTKRINELEDRLS